MTKALYQFSATSLIYFSLMGAYIVAKAINVSAPAAALAMTN